MKSINCLIITGLLLVTSLLTIPCLAQSSTDIVYKAPALSCEILNKEGNLETRINMGRDVFVFVNEFFQSYQIFFKNVDGETNIMTYYFIKKTETPGIIKVRDKKDNIYFLSDRLSSKGALIITESIQRTNGMVASFFVTKAVKTTLDTEGK